MSESCLDCLSWKDILIEFIDIERIELGIRSMEQIRIHQIRSANDQHFADFWRIYTESFPFNERRTPDQHIRIFQKPHYQINTYVIGNQLVGFIASWGDTEFVFVEHFAISPEFRSKRLGSTVLQQFIEEFNIPVILEIEMPIDELTKRRLKFYELAGFLRNQHNHYMPPYHKSNPPLEMEILTFPTMISDELYQRFAKFQKEVVMG